MSRERRRQYPNSLRERVKPRAAESKALRPKKREAKKRRPPYGGRFTTKNSHTSPRRITLLKKQREALELRQQGQSYEQIAQHMRRPVSTVSRWVFEAIERLTTEPAKAALKLELSKLDEIQAGIYPDAVQGHLPSVYAFLSVLDRRARLLGLFSEPGVQTAVALSIGGEQQQRQPISIEFISPTRRPSPEDEPRDVTPSPYQGQAPDYGKPVLPPPREARFRWPSPKGPHDWLK